jgi:ubiquitin C-terminal hydrolase
MDGQWYKFDDSQVYPASEEAVLKARQSAYLLFYHRKDQLACQASDDM